MIFETGSDDDFLSALLHGRRSRMAEAERLDALCAIRAIPELVHMIEPDAPNESVVDLQRRMVAKLANELFTFAWRVGGPAGVCLEWLAARFQVENLKVLARGMVTGAKLKDVEPYLVPLSKPFSLDADALISADSLETFVSRIPSTPLRNGVRVAMPVFERNRRAFFIEAGLDHGYLTELLARAEPLVAREEPDMHVLACQETNMFLLDLATRGHLTYDLRAEDLLPFYVSKAGIQRETFAAMLAAHDAQQVADEAAGRAIDRATAADAKGGEAREVATPGSLEVQALNRYYRLGYWIFRRSHVGVGVVAGYAAMRRVELANLISLSEGIRAGVAPAVLRRRLIPRKREEHASV
ncbi:MAG: V-type ATPase subunit [Planctomycetota bacterium]|nr:V-type ATPase subunit [Planctomycetota bacterium]